MEQARGGARLALTVPGLSTAQVVPDVAPGFNVPAFYGTVFGTPIEQRRDGAARSGGEEAPADSA